MAPFSGSSIVEACKDENLFGSCFGDMSSWNMWLIVLKALFAVKMTKKELEEYKVRTGREFPPKTQVSEGWLIVGRRGGKSFIMAILAVFFGTFINWMPYLRPGEKAAIFVVAADRDQARIIFRYILGILENIPMLGARMEKPPTARTIELVGNVVIEVRTASFRTIRGYTTAAVLMDEIAFWRSEGSLNPDYEILEAIRPSMDTLPGSMMICASSPHSKRGELHEMFKKYFGRETDDILVWKAPSWVMNPTLSMKRVNRAYDRDPVMADTEYGANFRPDIDSPIPEDVVDSSTVTGRFELPPSQKLVYSAFVDPSGGSQDSFTLGIAHSEENRGVLDLLMEFKPPFSPSVVVKEMAATLHRYGVIEVKGDHYAGVWPSDEFAKHGISYEAAGITKSNIYKEFIPVLMSDRAVLLDNKVMRVQLCNLERRTSRTGNVLIDHGPGGKDDLANVAAGCILECVEDDEVWGSEYYASSEELVSVARYRS